MISLSYVELFSVLQGIALVLQPVTELFWFSPTTLIGLISGSSKLLLYNTCAAPSSDKVFDSLCKIVKNLASEEPHISFNSRWREKNSNKRRVKLGLMFLRGSITGSPRNKKLLFASMSAKMFHKEHHVNIVFTSYCAAPK